jgi:hypothetical protein
MPMAVSHVAPAVGCVVGQGALHTHRSPPPPAGPAKPSQVQLVPSYGHARPTVVHAIMAMGSVAGQVPQSQWSPPAPGVHVQSVAP